MFDDDLFDDWLTTEAQRVMQKITGGEGVKPEEVILLVLKAQTNHFAHPDEDLRGDMKAMDQRLSAEMLAWRQDMDKRFEQVDKRLEQVDKRLEQADRHFEQIDKRFEQVDKRFEQVDKRFGQMVTRPDHFMFWSPGLTTAASGGVIAAVRFMLAP